MQDNQISELPEQIETYPAREGRLLILAEMKALRDKINQALFEFRKATHADVDKIIVSESGWVDIHCHLST